MDGTERRILGFCGLCHFFTHFTMLLLPPLATTIAGDLGINLGLVFRMSFLMYLLFGVGAVPWGYLADRWGPRPSMAAGIATAGAGLAAAGLIRDSAALPWCLGLVGLGNAAFHPAGLSLLSKGMRERGRALGLNGVFGLLGVAAAPFAAGLLGWSMGWRATFTVLGAVGLAVGAAIALVPFSVSRSEDRQRSGGNGGTRALPLFLLLCGSVVFAGLMYRSFTLILPSWIEARMAQQFGDIARRFTGLATGKTGMSPEGLLAAMISGLAMFIGIGGQLAGGKLADSMDLKLAYLLFVLAALPALAAGILLPGWAGLPLIGLFAFFAMGIQPIESCLYSVLIPPRWRSSGFGIRYSLAFGIGSLAVRIVAAAEPGWGLQGLMYLMGGYLLATIAMCLVLLAVGKDTVLRHVHG